MNFKRTIFTLVLILSTLMIFQACGEDPGGQQVDGIRLIGSVSDGDPVEGDVHAVDTQGNHYPGTSDSDGNYSITLPDSVAAVSISNGYFITAVGYSNAHKPLLQMSGYVPAAGTGNINPLMNAAMSFALGGDPQTILALATLTNGTPDFLSTIPATFNDAILEQAKTALAAILTPLLPPGASADDLLNCNVTTATIELMKLLRVVNISVASGTVYFTNNNDGTLITSIPCTVDTSNPIAYLTYVNTITSASSTILTAINDTTPPTISNKTLTNGNPAPDDIDFSWSVASDNLTYTNQLSYKVVYSLSDNVSTVSTALLNDRGAMPWYRNNTINTIINLSPGTKYYINVLVKDSVGNMSIYGGMTTTTTAL